ncbi:two-component system response regulator [Oceanidesulfovibrio indonesiensis]|nr:EAL domain-containing protein [Oceanidesulfovibrio indonesiensis]
MTQTISITGRTVLVVDDEPINTKLLGAYLKRAGYNAIEAQNGGDALIKARSQPDLILLDIMMPEMDGFETCRRLKADDATRDIPVIFLSALSDTEIKTRGLEVGGVDYVSKPFDSRELLARVSTHLTLREQERKIRSYAETLEEKVAERTNKLLAAEAELQRDFDIQSVVNALLRISLDDVELDEFLHTSLKQILSVPLLSFENRGAIFLDTEDTGEMSLVSYLELPEETVGRCRHLDTVACPCTEALVTRSIAATVEELDDGTEQHHVCAPINHGEMLLGVIDIHLKEGHTPDTKEMEFLDAVANTMARVILYKRAIRDLMRSEQHYRTIFESTGTAMAITDKQGAILLANSEFQRISGLSEQSWEYATVYDAIHEDDRDRARRHVKRVTSGQEKSIMLEVRMAGGSDFEQRSSTLVASNLPDGEEYVLSLLDVTDRKRAEQQVLHNARHDALTGLPNRVYLLDTLGEAVQRAQDNVDSRFVVLVMDLDRFNMINESLGHTIGDRLLVAMAGRLKSVIGQAGLLCRLGGDEFAVLLGDVEDVNAGESLARKILDMIRQPFAFGEQELVTTSSIGIATSDIGYTRPEDVLRDAETALHRAKLRGKARYEVFDFEMHLKARRLMQLVTDMRQAIKRQEFVLHYQPIVSLQTGRVEGVEALIRWQHPGHGLVSPGEFIPVAEESGLIIPIGQWALEEACRAMARFSERFGEELMLSVNISGKQFAQEDLFDHVKRALVLSGMKPRNLKLEITESVVMENAQHAIELLKRLKSLELQVSIDDFGTGYSSLSYLQRFPVDMLKIDRSFVSMMDVGSENMEIARTIVALAHSLSLEVVAEGVETVEQQEMLRALGCQFAQGFYYARPLPESVLMDEGVLASTWPMGS